jgi:protein-disulfide isomerase
MRLRILSGLAALAALATAAPNSAAPPARAASARAWTATIVATPEGGFRMGNPNARVKLVEYGSLTCGHCAAVARAGVPTLLGTYVRSGKVSYEYRSYILNGLDVAAALVARCGGAGRFFPVADRIYATQEQWMGRYAALSATQKAQLEAASRPVRLTRLADLTGLTTLAAQQGIAPVAAKRCLADPAGLDRLESIAAAAEALGVNSTPTFIFNGANIGTQTWATLEPILRESAG